MQWTQSVQRHGIVMASPGVTSNTGVTPGHDHGLLFVDVFVSFASFLFFWTGALIPILTVLYHVALHCVL